MALVNGITFPQVTPKVMEGWVTDIVGSFVQNCWLGSTALHGQGAVKASATAVEPT